MSEFKNQALEAYKNGDYSLLADLANKMCYVDGDYAGAIELLSLGLAKDPFNVKLRATRGRKYIGYYKYPNSVSDLSLASRLDPKDWEIWYYGGVAAFLADEFEMCKAFHNEARTLMLEAGIEAIPATVDWYWMACMKLGQKEEAQKILDEFVTEDMPSEDGDYKSRVLLYKGVLKPENFVEDNMCTEEEVPNAERREIYELMLTYGLANFYHYNGQDDKANECCLKVAKFPKHHNLFAWAQACRDLKDRGVEF